MTLLIFSCELALDVVLVVLQPAHLVGVKGPVLQADGPGVSASTVVNVGHALKNSENQEKIGILKQDLNLQFLVGFYVK